MKKIGIITSGGDCGGLNAVVKGAAQMAQSMGITAYVIPNGYAGLYNLEQFDELVVPMPTPALVNTKLFVGACGPILKGIRVAKGKGGID